METGSGSFTHWVPKPELGNQRMSISNTRLSNWAKLRRTGAEGWAACQREPLQR